jgi:tRNA A37 threonylcarbamoyladenosine biosynthesis protein TsaE
VRVLHGSDDAVSSPTFVFRQRYDPPAGAAPGAPAIEHVDLYRIAEPERELPDLGLEDAFLPDRIALVEWADRAPSWLPPDCIEIAIDGSGDGPRTVRVARP